MRIYDRINALPPKDIEKKSAHIVGGGIAGLSAAIALVTDAHNRIVVTSQAIWLDRLVRVAPESYPHRVAAAQKRLIGE